MKTSCWEDMLLNETCLCSQLYGIQIKSSIPSRGVCSFLKMGALFVVKWWHTEGIEREKTSSEKYNVISIDFWRDKLFLVFQIWGQNNFGGKFLEHCHLIWNYPWFLKRFLIFQIWGYYLQKVNAKCPQISDEKDKFFFHW